MPPSKNTKKKNIKQVNRQNNKESQQNTDEEGLSQHVVNAIAEGPDTSIEVSINKSTGRTKSLVSGSIQMAEPSLRLPSNTTANTMAEPSLRLPSNTTANTMAEPSLRLPSNTTANTMAEPSLRLPSNTTANTMAEPSLRLPSNTTANTMAEPSLRLPSNTTANKMAEPSLRLPSNTTANTMAEPSLRLPSNRNSNTMAEPSLRLPSNTTANTMAEPSLRLPSNTTANTMAEPSLRLPSNTTANTMAEPSLRLPSNTTANTMAEPSLRLPSNTTANTMAEPSLRLPSNTTANTMTEPSLRLPSNTTANTMAEPSLRLPSNTTANTMAEPSLRLPSNTISNTTAEPSLRLPSNTSAMTEPSIRLPSNTMADQCLELPSNTFTCTEPPSATRSNTTEGQIYLPTSSITPIQEGHEPSVSDSRKSSFLSSESASITGGEYYTKHEAIKRLLTICAIKNVAIPESIAKVLDPENRIKVVTRSSIVSSATYSQTSDGSYLETCAQHNQERLAKVINNEISKEILSIANQIKTPVHEYEVRIKNGGYRVMKTCPPVDIDGKNARESMKQNIPTVVPKGGVVPKLKHVVKTGSAPPSSTVQEKNIMADVNLRLQSGKMYLVLGRPGSGKSTFLKYIADRLTTNDTSFIDGELTINGIARDTKNVQWSSLVSYVDQVDRLHPLLTVKDTLRVAFNCRRNGTHRRDVSPKDDPEVDKLIQDLDNQSYAVNTVMRLLGLTRCKDTFVGNEAVRGVSGGEKKRVTVGEMLVTGLPIMCLDEISTGLDAATTFDIIQTIGEVASRKTILPIISLLQPPPETVALFDEVIFIDGGRILYTGPISDIVSYFDGIGYQLSPRIDTADWLLSLPAPEGKDFLKEGVRKAMTSDDFFQEFWLSPKYGLAIKQSLEIPLQSEYKELTLSKDITKKYRTSAYSALKYTFHRELLLWWRNKYQLKARIIQDMLVGVVTGTVFWNSTSPQSIVGVIFQSQFFISLGMMVKIPEQVDNRGIFYKHQDANFFPTWAFVCGRSLAAIPTAFIDTVVYGTIVYWCVGLAPTIENFLIFFIQCLFFAISFGLTMSLFSSLCKDRPTTQAFMSFTLVFMIIFGGFTVQPDIIPAYWMWAYWANLISWTLRALVLNEFLSDRYAEIQDNGLSDGENILIRLGFYYGSEDDPKSFTDAWTWYGLLFSLVFAVIATCASIYILNHIRYATGLSIQGSDEDEEDDDEKTCDAQDIEQQKQKEEVDTIDLPFTKVDMTFKDIHYFVKASTSDESLELLKGISGYFVSGKMTAVMGSSGAGKTTIMDILSLRKTKGTIEGEVRLNGHPQDKYNFKRCAGYVEQFDVQSSQLTVRETVTFSSKMRLDLENANAAVDENTMEKFINQTLNMLDLLSIQDYIVGSDLTGGLSFEQRKRLSIAIELVANPSIIFLDEPTSGLDARAAAIVMRGLKKIADTGRAVIATIHQPSQAIFYSFDYLLLLKRGGETVYFGELGFKSSNLIEYMESYECAKRIQSGENPATWMLTTIGSGIKGSSDERFDYARAYKHSKLEEECLAKIDEITNKKCDDNEITYPTKYARSRSNQRVEVLKRMMKIYWRSPSYNRTRLIIAVIVALLFGSVYVSQRTPTNESDMNSRVSSIYITMVFLGVYSFNTVLSVFEMERNMFYRHKASLMYDQVSLILAVTIVEIPFIMASSLLFNVFFYFMVGFSTELYRFLLYYLFFTLNMAFWTFFGQTSMALFKDVATAQGFGAVMNNFNALFAGVLIRPNYITSFWIFMYYLMPSHYILEGLLVSQFHNDNTPIEPSFGSEFAIAINGSSTCPDITDSTQECYGTAWQWVEASFGGYFEWDHLVRDVVYLVFVCIIVKVVGYIAMAKLNYLDK